MHVYCDVSCKFEIVVCLLGIMLLLLVGAGWGKVRGDVLHKRRYYLHSLAYIYISTLIMGNNNKGILLRLSAGDE